MKVTFETGKKKVEKIKKPRRSFDLNIFLIYTGIFFYIMHLLLSIWYRNLFFYSFHYLIWIMILSNVVLHGRSGINCRTDKK